MSVRIPPELLGIMPPGPAAPAATPTPPPGGMPAPPAAPPLAAGAPPAPPPGAVPPAMVQIGQFAAQINPEQMMQGVLQQASPNAETSFSSSGAPPPNTGPLDPSALTDPSDPLNDPVLAALLSGSPNLIDPAAQLPRTQRKGYRPLPDWADIHSACIRDKDRHRELLDRFQRDLLLYRNYRWLGSVPPLFDPKRDIAFRSATLPNIVNKLTNMSSAVDFRYMVEFKDEKTKQASQVIENFHMYNRKLLELDYAASGGDASLQWAEFWFLYLYGRLCWRVLPDLDAASRNEHFPYHVSLLDPATCFPTFGGDKGGLVRMTRTYNATMMDVLDDYGEKVPGLEKKLIDQLGYDTYMAATIDANVVNEVEEYWDTFNYAISYRGVEIVREPHDLGYVPFVYVVARGEPRNVTMPNGQIYKQVDEYNNINVATGIEVDLREKGVSVFHHIINTDRMSEIVYTLLVTEVLKAGNPATITYSAPQLAGKPAPPLKMHAGATNQRQLNAQKVESIPTSPRPTDVSPVMTKVQKDITEGSINTAMFGGMDGSNIAGFAVESLISAARDTVLPYQQAFCVGNALVSEMILKQYRSHIWMRQIASVPMDGRHGGDPTVDLRPEMVDLVGTRCKVEFIGVPDQALPMVMQASTQAVHEGFWSRRKAMEKLGEKDPDRMLSDIIAERAMEHPEMMENFIIPMGFIKRGQEDFAKLWIMFVIMPKLQTMMSSMMPMATPGSSIGGMPATSGGTGNIPASLGMPALGPGNGAGGPSPAVNGQSNPMAGRARGAPTGPLPGQGRS